MRREAEEQGREQRGGVQRLSEGYQERRDRRRLCRRLGRRAGRRRAVECRRCASALVPLSSPLGRLRCCSWRAGGWLVGSRVTSSKMQPTHRTRPNLRNLRVWARCVRVLGTALGLPMHGGHNGAGGPRHQNCQKQRGTPADGHEPTGQAPSQAPCGLAGAQRIGLVGKAPSHCHATAQCAESACDEHAANGWGDACRQRPTAQEQSEEYGEGEGAQHVHRGRGGMHRRPECPEGSMQEQRGGRVTCEERRVSEQRRAECAQDDGHARPVQTPQVP